MSSSEPGRAIKFRADIYEVPSIEFAMQRVMTPEPGTTTQERWEKETRYSIDDIAEFLKITPESRVVDYGCGVGRMSKALIERFGCRVIGIDTSRSMRLLAPEYVLSESFTAWSPEILEKMIAKGFRADFVVCLWVIQHALDAMDVIDRIDRVLAPGGLLYAMNQTIRCVPVDTGYFDDKFDIRAALTRTFSEENYHSLPTSVTTGALAAFSMIQVLRKRA